MVMRMIEKVTGKPFPVFMHDQLFRPLGMTAIRFDNAVEDGLIRKSEIVPHRASIYNWEDGFQKNQAFLFPNWTYPAGGLYSSAADVAKWAVALDQGKLLKPETMKPGALWADGQQQR